MKSRRSIQRCLGFVPRRFVDFLLEVPPWMNQPKQKLCYEIDVMKQHIYRRKLNRR